MQSPDAFRRLLKPERMTCRRPFCEASRNLRSLHGHDWELQGDPGVFVLQTPCGNCAQCTASVAKVVAAVLSPRVFMKEKHLRTGASGKVAIFLTWTETEQGGAGKDPGDLVTSPQSSSRVSFPVRFNACAERIRGSRCGQGGRAWSEWIRYPDGIHLQSWGWGRARD